MLIGLFCSVGTVVGTNDQAGQKTAIAFICKRAHSRGAFKAKQYNGLLTQITVDRYLHLLLCVFLGTLRLGSDCKFCPEMPALDIRCKCASEG